MNKHILGAALSFALVGCGGDSGNSSNTTNNTGTPNLGSSNTEPTPIPNINWSEFESLFGNNDSNIVDLSGYNADTVHIENSAKKVIFMNGLFFDALASKGGMSAEELLNKISASVLSGDPITLGSKGEIRVQLSTVGGGVGFVVTSDSMDLNYRLASFLEHSAGNLPFYYATNNQALKFEVTQDLSTGKYLYTRFEQGDVVYGFSENAQGDHEYVVKDSEVGIENDHLITYFANSQLVKVIKNGSEISTGTYNISTDTISGL